MIRKRDPATNRTSGSRYTAVQQGGAGRSCARRHAHQCKIRMGRFWAGSWLIVGCWWHCNI